MWVWTEKKTWFNWNNIHVQVKSGIIKKKKKTKTDNKNKKSKNEKKTRRKKIYNLNLSRLDSEAEQPAAFLCTWSWYFPGELWGLSCSWSQLVFLLFCSKPLTHKITDYFDIQWRVKQWISEKEHNHNPTMGWNLAKQLEKCLCWRQWADVLFWLAADIISNYERQQYMSDPLKWTVCCDTHVTHSSLSALSHPVELGGRHENI